MKKVMILMSAYTGHGHKSITDSLVEQFAAYPDVEVEVVEGFALIGRAAISSAKMYGPVTRNAQDLWKFTYLMSQQTSSVIADLLGTMIHDRLMKKLMFFHPDLIVCVHSLFNGSVLNVLEQYHLPIPQVTLQADIVNIHPSWCDERNYMTLCPTDEALEASLKLGMPREKLRRCGFPSRARFCDAARKHERRPYDGNRPLNCLLMSGGEGSGNLRRYAVEMLNHFTCNVTIICGRNERMKAMLEDTMVPKYGGRVRILGFCDNVQDYMLESDLMIARGSPNTLFEAIVCNVPVMITGALPGQEANNPQLMMEHGLGVVCKSPEQVAPLVSSLITHNGARLNQIAEAQRAYRNLDSAKEIVEYLYSVPNPEEYTIPQFKLKFPLRVHAKYALRVARKPFNQLLRPKK